MLTTNVSSYFAPQRLLRGALVLGLALVLIMIALSPALIARAQTAGGPGWSDNFDSYATGSDLHGVGGWKGWDNSPAASAIVTDVYALSAPNSVEIALSSDLVHEYPGYTSGIWIYTAWQYIPTGYAGDSYFIMQNIYNDGGPYDWSVQVHFDSGDNLVKSDGVEGFSAQTDIIYDQWVPIRVVIDLDNDHQRFYYDDVLIQECSWTLCQPSSAGTLTIGAVDLFANGASPVYYDNMSLTPASAGDLAITKETDATIVEPGDSVTYVINYTNNSTDTTESEVSIVDLIPAELVDVSFTASGVVTATGTYTWEVGALAPGDSGTITVTATVDSELGDEGFIDNTASLIPAGDYNPTNNSATASIEVNIAPDVDAGPDQQVDPGDLVTFAGSFTDPGGDDTHTYEWDIDGNIITDTLTPTYTFAIEGFYVVTLTVTDSDGAVGMDTVEIQVGDPQQFIYLPVVVYNMPTE